VDTLSVTGASTSGCVRATAVDAYRPVVPREANLYGIDTRYSDVVPVKEVLEYLEEVAAARTLSRPYARAEIARLRRSKEVEQ